MKLIDYLRNLNPSPVKQQERFETLVMVLGFIGILIVCLTISTLQ